MSRHIAIIHKNIRSSGSTRVIERFMPVPEEQSLELPENGRREWLTELMPQGFHLDRFVEVVCGTGSCGQDGAVDSGGVTPWGEPIWQECPECRYHKNNEKPTKK